MGSPIEINDTLKISVERGFPKDLLLEDHLIRPEQSDKFLGKEFEFYNVGRRLYNQAPTRVFIVQETADSKWIYWGHALVTEQTITPEETRGKYKIMKIYDPAYQRLMTINEAPSGKSFF